MYNNVPAVQVRKAEVLTKTRATLQHYRGIFWKLCVCVSMLKIIGQVGFSFRHTGSQIWIFSVTLKVRIARTKNAVNLLDWARWKNTQLLGTSNLISFLLGATDTRCSLGGRKKSVTTTSKTIFVAMTIWDSLALLWSLGWMKSRSEGRDRPRGLFWFQLGFEKHNLCWKIAVEWCAKAKKIACGDNNVKNELSDWWGRSFKL